MFFWIIQNIIISIILIMSIHYTYLYFKTNLTVPKTKDLVKKPIEQYRKIYNSIQQDIPEKIDKQNMKGELKNYLKELTKGKSSTPSGDAMFNTSQKQFTPFNIN